MTRRVVVSGVGAVSALGVGVDELFDGLLSGRAGVKTLSDPGDGLKVTSGAEVEHPDRSVADRDVQMATAAIDAALAQAGLAAHDAAFSWGCGLDTFQTRDNILRSAGRCFSLLAARHARPRRMFAVACATGTHTIGEAFRLIRGGAVDTAVAGGSSVMLTPCYLVGFSALGAIAVDVEGEPAASACKPFDESRRGFALGDGAGALVLESLDSALARGAAPLCEIIGFGTSQDAFDISRPPPDGRGARRCIERALGDGGLNASDIDVVNAHGTGTYAGDIAEAAAIRAMFGGRASDVSVHSVKGSIGHAMAAAGALEAIVAIETVRRQLVPPTGNLTRPAPDCELSHVIGAPQSRQVRRVLSQSFGMGGQNAAIVLQEIRV